MEVELRGARGMSVVAEDMRCHNDGEVVREAVMSSLSFSTNVILILLLELSLASCIVLPFPHDVIRTPLLSGKVVDARTGFPIEGVVITAGPAESRENESIQLTSDQLGQYSVQVTQRSWWVVIWWAPVDPVCPYHLTFRHPSFQTVDVVTILWGSCAGAKLDRVVRMERNSPEQESR